MDIKMNIINKQKADLNKDNKLSPYEKKRGIAIQNAMRKPTDPKFNGMTDNKNNRKVNV